MSCRIRPLVALTRRRRCGVDERARTRIQQLYYIRLCDIYTTSKTRVLCRLHCAYYCSRDGGTAAAAPSNASRLRAWTSAVNRALSAQRQPLTRRDARPVAAPGISSGWYTRSSAIAAVPPSRCFLVSSSGTCRHSQGLNRFVARFLPRSFPRVIDESFIEKFGLHALHGSAARAECAPYFTRRPRSSSFS